MGLGGSGEGHALTAADLAANVDKLVAEARSHGRGVTLRALEELYTTGCAQALELEAEAVRLQRRRQDATALRETLTELRRQIRHIRTATEWLREESTAASDA